MIVQLDMENWKSYAKSSLYIDRLSVLVGTNASGKSNALDAFSLLNRTANGSMLTSALQGDGSLTSIRGGIDWAARRPGDRFALGVTCRADEITDYEYRVDCQISGNRCDIVAELRWSSNFGHNDRFSCCHFPFVDGGRQITQC
ncbi:AAA family ATPase [Massilia sp. DWR3-1-1]|uniref:AAA family ATPase n=1 Tax=Massilia sp. DWR3-1-1 TaxID=2804559 RepID=UPI003CF54910